MKTFNSIKRWLLPATLLLFIFAILTLPVVIGLTYSGRSESPEHILTYTPGVLRWDSGTKVNDKGAAELSLFSAALQHTKSTDGAKLLAPGTEGDSIVRLKNNTTVEVNYTAVLYAIKSSDTLPVSVGLSGTGFAEADKYSLPEGITQASTIRAVKGVLAGSAIQDFDIDWFWTFEKDEERDLLDTYFGDKAAVGGADDMTVGLYIVVQDDKSVISADTGDYTVIGGYAMLALISAALVVFLLVDRRRQSRKNEI